MSAKKGKKGKKSAIPELYDGFCAPSSLLLQRFKENAARIPLDLAAAFIMALTPPPEQSLSQIIIGEPISACGSLALSRTLHDVYYTKLRSLCFWNAKLGDDGCAFVCSSIVYLPSLNKLEIQDSGMGVQGCTALSLALRQYRNRRLYTMSFSCNAKLDDDALKALTAGMMFQKHIGHFDLSFCGLTFRAGQTLADMLRGQHCHLKALNLEGNNLGSTGVLDLAHGIIANRMIERINLANNKLDPAGLDAIQAMAEVMQGTPTLVDLDLNGNLITDEGASMLLDGVTKSPQITRLTVSHLGRPDLVKTIVSELMTRRQSSKPGKSKKGGGKK